MDSIHGAMKVGITDDGIEAERKARNWLRGKGVFNLQQLDWLYKASDGRYFCIECKARELYKAPPFDGTGLDIKQLNLRKQLYDDLSIDTILLVYEKGTNNIYWQMITKLELGRKFDTKNKIRIYDILSFNKEINV